MAPKFVDVETEYDKDKELKKQDVDAFVDWAQKQPHLPKITELQAILFLRSCYYSNEATKATIDTFFTVRTLVPEMYLNRNPLRSPLKETINACLFMSLSKKTPEGFTIIFCKMMDANPEVFNFTLCIKYFEMAIMMSLYEQGTSDGHVIVMDFGNIVFGHLAKLGPLGMKKFLYYLQEALPVRLKGLHYFNTVSFMDKVLALMKPFMKKDLMNMLYLHQDVEGLIKHIPRECLPNDYGGTAGSCTALHDQIKRQLNDNVELFEWEDSQTVDESRRPGKPKNMGDVFGVEGTFKKLELD